MRTLLAAFLLIVATPIGGQPQQAPPVFRLGTELVVVDLIPTDRAGRFVADLQPSDIRLLEDGQPQRIEFLRLVRLRPDDTPASSPSGVQPSQPGTPLADDARAPDAKADQPGAGAAMWPQPAVALGARARRPRWHVRDRSSMPDLSRSPVPLRAVRPSEDPAYNRPQVPGSRRLNVARASVAA